MVVVLPAPFAPSNAEICPGRKLRLYYGWRCNEHSVALVDPSPEGSWPNTAQYFKDNFSDFPVADGRRILGENAIEFYGLDRAKLQAVADDQLHFVPPDLIQRPTLRLLDGARRPTAS